MLRRGGLFLSMITRITSDVCRQLRTNIEELLRPYGLKHGITIRGGNARFRATQVTMKLEIHVNQANGQPVDAYESYRQDFSRFCESYDLQPGWLGKTFNFGFQNYTVLGLSLRSRKYPILCRRGDNNKVYKLKAETVRYGLTPKR